jgi:hypothetical protein
MAAVTSVVACTISRGFFSAGLPGDISPFFGQLSRVIDCRRQVMCRDLGTASLLLGTLIERSAVVSLDKTALAPILRDLSASMRAEPRSGVGVREWGHGLQWA